MNDELNEQQQKAWSRVVKVWQDIFRKDISAQVSPSVVLSLAEENGIDLLTAEEGVLLNVVNQAKIKSFYS